MSSLNKPIVIPLRVRGDSWTNPTEVKNCLSNIDPSVHVEIDLRHEGPSMQALGIVDMLNQHCVATGRDPETISIVRNPNMHEQTPYKNLTTGIWGVSHFFEMSRKYWTDVAPVSDGACLFGYFMGRRTFARARMLYDLWQQGNTLLSLMTTDEAPPWIEQTAPINLEKLDDWLNSDITSWFDCCPVTSIDGHTSRDLRVREPRTNSDLLGYYNQFCIEIVAETFTMGDTFFPTEKTVRPIMAGKPVLVYGPRNYLKRLQDIGFQTYSSCWDESYDQLEGPTRWQAMKETMSTIDINDNFQAIACYNRSHLAKLIG
jgi:hypothetical protein